MRSFPKCEILLSRVCSRLGIANPLAGTMLGLAVYVVGLLIALVFKLEGLYLRTPLFWLAAVGIAWVCGWLVWGCDSYKPLLDKMAVALDIDEHKRGKVIQYISQMSKMSTPLLLTVFLTASACTFLYFVMRGFCEMPSAHWYLSVPRILPESFYDGKLFSVKLALISIYFPFGAYLLATGCILLVYDVRVMRLLAQCDLGVQFLQALYMLNSIGKFHLYAAASWFVGVETLIIGMQQMVTPLIAFIVSVLSSLGFAFFFVPQYAFHRKLTAKKAELEEIVDAALFTGQTQFSPLTDNKTSSLFRLFLLLQIKTQVAALRTWPFDSRILIQLSMSFAVPIGAFILKVLTSTAVSH